MVSPRKMSDKFKIGTLVWAKMKGFSPWPGLVSQAKDWLKKPAKKSDFKCIYFFGSRNYAYIEEACLMPYREFKSKLLYSSKSSTFKEAVNEIEEFIQRMNDDPSFDPAEFDADKLKDETFDRVKEIPDVTSSILTPPHATSLTTLARKKKSLQDTSMNSSKRSSINHSTPKSLPAKKRKTSIEEEIDESPSASPLSLNYTKNYEELLNRPVVEKPQTPKMNLNEISEEFLSRRIEPSTKSFGFIGLGLMGSGIVKNLINSGHKVNLWNRTLTKAEAIKEQAKETRPGMVNVWPAPCDVVYNSDIIFSCVSDIQAAKNVVFANCGVLHDQDASSFDGKGYVEMTSIDMETSKDFHNVITKRKGRYLEAQLQGSKNEADSGNLVILGAGDRSLFDDCQSCFQAMGKTAFFLGDVGYATKMNLALQLIKGIAIAGLTEGFVLADRSGLALNDLVEIFSLTNMSSVVLMEKAKMIINSDFRAAHMPLQHLQKDLKLAIDLSEGLQQPMVLAATANEVYKHARRLGYDQHDVAAVYMRARH